MATYKLFEAVPLLVLYENVESPRTIIDADGTIKRMKPGWYWRFEAVAPTSEALIGAWRGPFATVEKAYENNDKVIEKTEKEAS